MILNTTKINNPFFVSLIMKSRNQKYVSKKDRHIRWNWEQSPEMDDADCRHYVRYHFIVVDDRDREGIMRKLIKGLIQYGEVIERKHAEGIVRGTGLRYLFKSYDSVIKPEMLDWRKIRKSIRKDNELRERKRGNIEDYVARVYSS